MTGPGMNEPVLYLPLTAEQSAFLRLLLRHASLNMGWPADWAGHAGIDRDDADEAAHDVNANIARARPDNPDWAPWNIACLLEAPETALEEMRGYARFARSWEEAP